MQERISHHDPFSRAGKAFAAGQGTLIEPAVTVIRPGRLSVGESVYIGHYSIIDGGRGITIGDGTWIGQNCFLDGSGGIVIGKNVGIGPGVKIITSAPAFSPDVMPLELSSVVIEDDSDIGIGARLLPGSVIGRGAQIGAGAVIVGEIPPYAIAAGIPARVMRMRGETEND